MAHEHGKQAQAEHGAQGLPSPTRRPHRSRQGAAAYEPARRLRSGGAAVLSIPWSQAAQTDARCPAPAGDTTAKQSAPTRSEASRAITPAITRARRCTRPGMGRRGCRMMPGASRERACQFARWRRPTPAPAPTSPGVVGTNWPLPRLHICTSIMLLVHTDSCVYNATDNVRHTNRSICSNVGVSAAPLGWGGGGLHYGYGYRLQAIGHANPRSGRTARLRPTSICTRHRPPAHCTHRLCIQTGSANAEVPTSQL